MPHDTNGVGTPEDWLKRAKSNLAIARQPKTAEILWEDYCFELQQAAEKALKAVLKAEPKRIVYVSCNPQTMARDLQILAKAEYTVEIVQPVDMFPQTDHVETVAKLSRGS